MAETTAPPSAPPARIRRAGWGALAAAGLVLTLYFYSPVREVATATLDGSNYSSYAYFTAQGFQYGADVAPMAGPYGFVLYGWVYGGQLFGVRTAGELLLDGALAALTLWFFRSHRPAWLAWLWLAAHVAFTPFHEDLMLEWSLLLAGIFLIRTEPRCGIAPVPALVVLLVALLSLVKGTQLLLAAGTLAVALGCHATLRRWGHVAKLAGLYAGALVAWWLVAGQNPLHLPAYLYDMLELARGYNAAMGLEEAPAVFHRGLAVSLALAALVAWLLARHRRDRLALAAIILLAGHAFAQWKHGFVRADGHAFIYFHFAVVAALALPLAARPAAPTRPAGRGTTAVEFALVLAVVGLGSFPRRETKLPDFAGTAVRVRDRLGDNFAQLAALPATQEVFEARLAAERALLAMPLTRRAVGGHSIDQFGFEHARLTLNGLNYRPRPMGGGPFNAYTPALMQLNRDFIRDPARRPAFFLAKLETLDERLLAQDDGLAFADLISLYEPELMEQDHLLLRARTGATPAEPRVVSRVTFQIGDTVPVPAVRPDELLLARFSVRASLAGRLRSLLYKPPRVRLALHGPDIPEPNSYRLVPVMAASPFLLGPLVERTRDLLEIYAGMPGRWPAAFRVSTANRFWFDRTVEVEFQAMPRPAPATGTDPAALLPFTRAAMETVHTTLAGSGAPVQVNSLLAHAPSQYRWDLDGSERTVSFGFGLVPGANELTDGVDFTATLLRPGEPAQVLFQRTLDPRREPADRGHHRVRLALPPLPPGSRLELSTGPGPHGNNAYDWAYLSELSFSDPEQPAPAGR